MNSYKMVMVWRTPLLCFTGDEQEEEHEMAGNMSGEMFVVQTG